MTVALHARSYDISASGLFFESYEDFAEKAAKMWNDRGDPVEEFEIQFIDGERIDRALVSAMEAWDDDQKARMILAVGECSYDFTAGTQPDDLDLDIYLVETLRQLTEQFVEEGLFCNFPDRLQIYID